MTKNLDDLMSALGYQFKNTELLEQALKHRSYSKNNNERLEFLGDSVVNFIVASELFHHFPKAKEGQLSRLRSNLVKTEPLANLAKTFNVNEFLRLGKGEEKSGGAERSSILEDAMEAIIGAIYLDSNMKTCYSHVARWYRAIIDQLSLEEVYKDPKSLLQEYLQSKQMPLPEYRLSETRGQEHNQIFVIECRVLPLKQGMTGEGTSRRRAEQKAAEKVLKALGEAAN
ncbi:MAG: ribonuclease III [Gammaproteobacteria bacterium]|nr:ribonuclease III [Gammaproteobacteria bacterium]